MSRTLKKFISLLLVVVVLFAAAPLSGFVELEHPNFANILNIKAEAAESYSGTCGYNLTWTLDKATGLLKITGEGEMTDWSRTYSGSPFGDFSDDIKQIIIEEGVTSIGGEAFDCCDQFTEIYIPASVTKIGESAFSFCTELRRVIFAEESQLLSIDTSAFHYCYYLTGFSIPDTVVHIGEGAFHNIPVYRNQDNWIDGVLYIDNCLVEVKETLSGSYSVLPGTRVIADYAFSHSSVSNVDFPESLRIIGDNAFSVETLESVSFEKGLVKVGESAFYGCLKLKEVNLPEGVKSIGNWAFYGCESLTSVFLPDSINSIGSEVFLETSIYENSNNWVNGAFYIGNHLIKYSDYSKNNYQLKADTKSIAGSAFYSCSSLETIEVPDGLIGIGPQAFWHCSDLVEFTIPNSIVRIEDGVFSSCKSLSNIMIPHNVTNIGEGAFWGCENLSSVAFSNSLKSIGNNAFRECDLLENIKFPESLINIGSYAFEGCDSISEIIFPNSVENIDSFAFENCKNLETVTLSDNLIVIAQGLFHNCAKLSNITFGKKGKIIGNSAFKKCDSLLEVILPSSIETIGSYSFSDCDNLKSITIETGTKLVGDYSFYMCDNFVSITIPNSVTQINYGAFSICENLKDVYYCGTKEQWNSITIGANNEYLTNATIHFNSIGDSTEEPDDTEKYKNATITLDQNSYTVKEPKSLTIEGTITCPDGVEGLSMSWSFDEIDIFYTPSQTTYETVSETEMRFSQTFTPKKAGKFKVYARLPNDAEAECTVTSYQEAVSAFISEHYQFVKSDKYNDFVAEEYAQELAESMRNNSSYHWNNFVSINFFENYYDLVLAELLTNDTTKQSVKEEIEKIFSSEYVDLTNKLFDFINKTYQDSLGPISEADFYLVFNADTPKVYEDTAIYKALTKGLEDKTLFNNVFEINELFGYAQKIADAKECAVEGIVDCVYYFAAINAYRKADEEIKAVITKAAAKTNNSDLKESLESFASIDSENDYLGFAESLFDKFIDVGRKTAVKICFNSFDFERTLKYILNIKLKDGTKLADKVVKVVSKNGTTVGTIAQYANAVFAGVSLGMAVSELITNADDYSFYASKCTHAGDLAEVLLNVLNESAIDFKENKTLENAHFFDVAFNFYKDTQIYALNAMVESIYAQNSSAVAVIINKAKSASGYISTINRYKNLNCHKHDLTELINAEYYYVDEKYSGNKLIRVACPVDVYVYDSEGNLALSIENDFVEIFDDRLDAFVLNSEKYICVPLDEEFTIKIVSTDDGEMDYSVFEFDENSEMNREVSKENISLVNEKTFEGKIDNIINTAVDNYSLIVTDTQENIAMDNDVDCVPATNISISKSFVELKVGQSQGLVASISPINTTDKYVWISSDETVATVSENGTVNAIGEGNATIVAMVNDLIYAECEVNVVILKDYTISWVVDGVATSQTVTEGDAIVKPINPTKTDYAFIGWSPAVPDTMPAYDLTFTAVFEKSYICPDCGDEILGEDTINNHIASEARMKATVKIKNNSGSKTINYGETLRLTAVTTEMPTDVKIYWFVDGVKKDEGETFNVSFESGTKTVEVKLVDSNGNAIKNASGNEISDSESVTVKGGFFQKLISFFKNLFGVNRTVVQAFKVIL